MRIGQTSFVVFVSKLLGSVLGFVATLYFARILGAEVLGYYASLLAVVSWLKLGGTAGSDTAVVKRVSEGEDRAEYFTAALCIVTVLGLVLSVAVAAAGNLVDAYVGAEVWPFVVVLLLTGLLTAVTQSTLKGEQKVHVAGVLRPVNLTISSLAQIALVVLGFGLGGMLVGYAVGELLIGVVGASLLSSGLRRPGVRHFRHLYDFAKYSWLTSLKQRSFSDVDIIVLTALVSPGLVGIYSIAWSISKFLTLFGNAVRNTLFPEISQAEAAGESDRIAQLTTDSVAFVGLVTVPGLVGGAILADRLLAIYGEEFTAGATIMVILIFAVAVYGYQQHLMGVLRAIDRPDVAFRINLVFLLTNLVLNVVLVYLLGWTGAAIATAVSAAIGLGLSFRSVRDLVDFDVPWVELARQVAAAGVMGVAVYASRWAVESLRLVRHNAAIVVGLVGIGAGVYFVVLLVISPRFRDTVATNSPVRIPMLTWLE